LNFSYKFNEKFTLPTPNKDYFQVGLRTGFLGGTLAGVLFVEIMSVLGVENVWVMYVGKLVFCVFILVLLFTMKQLIFFPK